VDCDRTGQRVDAGGDQYVGWELWRTAMAISPLAPPLRHMRDVYKTNVRRKGHRPRTCRWRTAPTSWACSTGHAGNLRLDQFPDQFRPRSSDKYGPNGPHSISKRPRRGSPVTWKVFAWLHQTQPCGGRAFSSPWYDAQDSTGKSSTSPTSTSMPAICATNTLKDWITPTSPHQFAGLALAL